ncbi:aldo/keto reductase [Gemmiger sp.]|uniref:aldo/keto reductase n=1 Tax=Gemmiger sp. TaxID=2049027 RepID=UPI003FA5EA44
MMILQETYHLENGVQIPKLGLGTWFIDDDKAAKAVRDAVKVGYRLIDTAQAYGNERGVGEGVRTCGLPREELFVTSKVAAEVKTYEEAARSIDETLTKMGLDYLDLMIIHSPQPWAEFRVENRYFAENKEVWRALEDAYAAGKLRAIGVSNFLQDDLENLLDDCRIKPMVNQILLHITNTDKALLDYCRAQGILVEAYSPIAHGEALKNPAITKMAKKYNVTSAQLCIRYVLQLGTVALPKTANPAHMQDNSAVDFQISTEDMRTLEAMEKIKSYGEFDMFPVFSGKPLS